MTMTTSVTPPHAPISDAALDQLFRTARTYRRGSTSR
jgi:hypothetical protein